MRAHSWWWVGLWCLTLPLAAENNLGQAPTSLSLPTKWADWPTFFASPEFRQADGEIQSQLWRQAGNLAELAGLDRLALDDLSRASAGARPDRRANLWRQIALLQAQVGDWAGWTQSWARLKAVALEPKGLEWLAVLQARLDRLTAGATRPVSLALKKFLDGGQPSVQALFLTWLDASRRSSSDTAALADRLVKLYPRSPEALIVAGRAQEWNLWLPEVTPADNSPTPTKPAPTKFQMGVFARLDNAQSLVERLKSAGLKPDLVALGPHYRVTLTTDQPEVLVQKLKTLGLVGIVVKN